MKRICALFLCFCGLSCYAADALDTIRISVEQPDYLAYDNEQGMWLYEGSAKVNNVNYKMDAVNKVSVKRPGRRSCT